MKAKELGWALLVAAAAVMLHHYCIHGYAFDFENLLSHEFFAGALTSAGIILVFYHRISKWVK